MAAVFVDGSRQNEQTHENLSTFSGDDFLEINQSETRIAYGEFRRRFLKIGQSETRIACGSHVCQHRAPMFQVIMTNLYRGSWIGTKWATFCLWSLNRSDKMSNLYREPFHFQRRWFFRNQPIRNKNCLWRISEKIFKNRPIRNKNSLWQPCLSMDRDKMSNLYRGPSIDASTKFHFIWLSKNCLWWPCLLTDQDEMSNVHRGHSIDASYQVLVNLAKRFQRKEEEIFVNWPIRNKNCLWWKRRRFL